MHPDGPTTPDFAWLPSHHVPPLTPRHRLSPTITCTRPGNAHPSHRVLPPRAQHAAPPLPRVLEAAAGMMELRKYWGVGGRRCGGCEAAPAAVHCRTCGGGGGGGAYLCAGCDEARPGHGRAGRHQRVWMCEVCEVSPAAVTCKADAAVLCAACDADIHDANPLAQRHVRVPLAPIGSAEEAAMLFSSAALGEEEEVEVAAHHVAAAAEQQQHHALLNLNVEAKDMKLDYLFSDLVDPYLSAVEFAPFPHADSVVPNGGTGAAAAVELDFTCGLGAKPSSYSSYTATSLAHSGSSSEVGVVPEAMCGGGAGSFELDFTRPKAPQQSYMPYTAAPPSSHGVMLPEQGDAAPVVAVRATGEGREARLMRYREKRKNRRFEKTIRYASRKAYAESRPRVKGRFAKRPDHDAEDCDAEADGEAAVPVPSSFMLDFGYGVVPTF